MDLKLKGTVYLDEESMIKLKEQIREQVIQEIKEEGNYFSEIESFLKDCGYINYYLVLQSTIEEVISNTNTDDITFKEEMCRWRKLLLIRDLLKV